MNIYGAPPGHGEPVGGIGGLVSSFSAFSLSGAPQDVEISDWKRAASGPQPASAGSYIEARPTPKALFRDPSYKITEPPYLAPPSSSGTTISTVAQSDCDLRGAVLRGEWSKVQELCTQMLTMAYLQDTDGILAMLPQDGDEPEALRLSVPVGAPAATTAPATPLGAEVDDPGHKLTFSNHITVLDLKDTGMVSHEQVSSGVGTAVSEFDEESRREAKNLISMLHPLFATAYNRNRSTFKQNFPSSVPLLSASTPDVDIVALRDSLMAVSNHCRRRTMAEPRLLELSGPCHVLGDVHGNLLDLEFFARCLWPAGPEAAAGSFLFLGDFVDRGKDSIAAVGYIMAMKILHPKKWWMIRGNHETREVNGNIDHYQDGSFLRQCYRLFGETDGQRVWESVNTFFDTLPLAATIDGKVFCVHGGIPRSLCNEESSLDMIRQVENPLRFASNNRMVYDMLWSDPTPPARESQALDGEGFGQSPRGSSCFGKQALERFLQKYKFEHILRGHEAQKSGVGVNTDSRITTIFSTSSDHFPGDIRASCGSVLVENGQLKPMVKRIDESPSLKPTYAGYVEPTDLQQASSVNLPAAWTFVNQAATATHLQFFGQQHSIQAQHEPRYYYIG